MTVALGRKTVLTVCSTMHCHNPERLYIAWWLPQTKVPLCERCYVRWCRALGITNLR